MKMFGGPTRMFPGPRCGSRRAWLRCAQVSYQVGCRDVVKRTFAELWNHFIDQRVCPEIGWITKIPHCGEFTLTLYRSTVLVS